MQESDTKIDITMTQQPTCFLRDLIQSLQPTKQEAFLGGQPVVHSTGNRYTGKILIPASRPSVWDVATDYSRFDQFLPSVESSTILEAEGDRAVIEQVSVLKVLMAEVRSRIRTENFETPQSQIDFRLIGGDLKSMKGAWTLQSVITDEGEPTSKHQSDSFVLLQQTVRAEPKVGLFEGPFSMIFINSMKDNLSAIRQESMQRAATAQHPLTQTH